MKGKGYKLQKAMLAAALEPITGKKGECAFCEHVLTKQSELIYVCEDCQAIYHKLDNDLLDYVGRRK